jgi:hypothetical protein
MPRSSAAARPLIDHDEIRQWAEERGARPSRVSGTGVAEDVGMIRLDFPGYSGGESLEEISWDEWFDNFDDRNLALMVQHETTSGEISNFNKLVSRHTAEETAEEVETGIRPSARRAAGTRPKREGARAASRRGVRSRGRSRSKSRSRTAKATSRKRSSRSTKRSSRKSRTATSQSRPSRSTQARSAKRRGAQSSRSSTSRRKVA